MEKTILHIGPPKTGTTTLQEQVFPSLSSVCYMGKPWWNPNIRYDKCLALHRAIDSVTKAAPGAYDETMAKAAVDEWLAHAPAAQPRPDGNLLPRLLSEERLSFTDNVSMDEIARRLSVLFPAAEVVFIKRDPVSGLRSFYRWMYARAWIDDSFSDWLERGLKPGDKGNCGPAMRSYDWPLIESAFGAYFPVVRSLEFRDMLSDIGGFLEAFFGFKAAEFDSFNWLKDRPLNVSRNRAVSELYRMTKKAIRLWNRLPFGKIDEKPEYLGDTPFWKAIEAPLRRLGLGEGKLAVTEADCQRILSYYAGRGVLPIPPDGSMSAGGRGTAMVGNDRL